MSNQVYANTMEVACKAASGKSICAFPDVCFTPPQTPATPPGVPIPYPNTGLASDCSEGSSTVRISGEEVMLKNKSYFKKSMGDEAGCAPQKGVVTSQNMGKVYFAVWSMDVRIEGENVVRAMDMTTHNHASPTPNTPPMAYFDEVAVTVPDVCKKHADEATVACKDATKRPQKITPDGNLADDGLDCSEDCKRKQKCILIPKKNDKQGCCSPDTTGHHLIEDHWIKGNPAFSWYRSDRGGGGFTAQSMKISADDRAAGVRTVHDAPCVCGNESRSEADHQELHNVQATIEESYLPPSKGRPAGARYQPGQPGNGFTYGEGKKTASASHDTVYSSENPQDACDDECLKAQLDAFYHASEDAPLNTPHRQQPIGTAPRALTAANWSSILNR